MKFLAYLLLLARRSNTAAAHNDNLRAGKDVSTGLVRPSCGNSLLL